MKTRLPFLLLSLVLVAALAACGGGGSSGPVPADAIAQVGSTPVAKATFNDLKTFACAKYKVQGQACPTIGTPTYTSLRDGLVAFLVQETELQQEADKLGVSVTQKDVDQKVESIKKQYYQGSENKFDAALKKDDITLAQLEQFELRPSLLGQKVEEKIAGDYYNQHKSAFKTPETREVRHILVKSKTLAQKLEQQVKNGANFAKLAKKYSKDTGSAAQGGKLCVAHGAASPPCNPTVAPFDKATFSLKTNDVTLVHSVFGWHVLQAIGPVTPSQTETFAQIKSMIEANQAPPQVTAAWQAWLAKMGDDFKGKVSYATGYAPAATTTSAVPTTTG